MGTSTNFEQQLTEWPTIVTMAVFGLAASAVAPAVLSSLFRIGVPSGASEGAAAGVLLAILLSPVMFFALAYQGYTDRRA